MQKFLFFSLSIISPDSEPQHYLTQLETKVVLGNALSSAFWKLSKTSIQSCSPLHFSSAPWICSLPAADVSCIKL